LGAGVVNTNAITVVPHAAIKSWMNKKFSGQ
jgi:hypothetical protein